MKRLTLIALLACLPAVAPAQTLTGVKLDPPEIKAGESVKITVGFEVQGTINCGLRLHFGDGTTKDFKINQEKDVPLVLNHAYAKPGSYKVKAEPKTVDYLLKCSGKNQSTTLTVTAPPAAAAAKGAAPAAVSQCPEGWKLDTKSVNKKTGAFTCTAKAGTALPAGKLACPGDLAYFENAKKGQLGCRP